VAMLFKMGEDKAQSCDNACSRQLTNYFPTLMWPPPVHIYANLYSSFGEGRAILARSSPGKRLRYRAIGSVP
jgi:hypothetical protein